MTLDDKDEVMSEWHDQVANQLEQELDEMDTECTSMLNPSEIDDSDDRLW